MNSKPAALPKVDWAYYENKVTDKTLLAKLKEKYESLKIEKPQFDNKLLEKIAKEQEAWAAQTKQVRFEHKFLNESIDDWVF